MAYEKVHEALHSEAIIWSSQEQNPDPKIWAIFILCGWVISYRSSPFYCGAHRVRFCFYYIVFRYIISISFFFINSVYLMMFSTLSFVASEFSTDFWTIFMMATSKFVLNSSNIWFILMLVSVDCLLSFKLCALFPGNFGYYTIRFWIHEK